MCVTKLTTTLPRAESERGHTQKRVWSDLFGSWSCMPAHTCALTLSCSLMPSLMPMHIHAQHICTWRATVACCSSCCSCAAAAAVAAATAASRRGCGGGIGCNGGCCCGAGGFGCGAAVCWRRAASREAAAAAATAITATARGGGLVGGGGGGGGGWRRRLNHACHAIINASQSTACSESGIISGSEVEASEVAAVAAVCAAWQRRHRLCNRRSLQEQSPVDLCAAVL